MATKKMENIPVRNFVPPGMVLTYSDQVVVTASENAVVASFFQTDFPVDASAKHARAVCVARIVLPPSVAREFIGTLSKTLGMQFAHSTALEAKSEK